MKNIAKIVPLQKLPRGVDSFDYLIPNNLLSIVKPGALVNIPWRSGSTQGLVWQVTDKSEFAKLKSVIGIEQSLMPLRAEHLDFIEWLSSYYHVSSSVILKMFVPVMPRRTRRTSETSETSGTSKYKFDEKFVPLIKDFLNTNDSPFLLFPRDYEQHQTLLIDLAVKAISGKGQTVILFPEMKDLEDFKVKLPVEILNQSAVVSHELKTAKNNLFKVINQVRTGEIKLILGTRSAILLPFNNLQLIYINRGHSEHYKSWDQNPRFHAIDAAWEWQRLFKCNLVLSSLTPRAEDYYYGQKAKAKQVTLGRKVDNVVFTDNNRFSPLENLQEKLKEIFIEEKKNLLLVGREKDYQVTLCADCGYTPHCSDCGKGLVLTTHWYCSYCKKEISLPIPCPKCSGVNWKSLGQGIKVLTRELQKAFPHKKIGFSENDELRVALASQLEPSRKVDNLILYDLEEEIFVTDYLAGYRSLSRAQEIISKWQNQAENIVYFSLLKNSPVYKFWGKPFANYYREELAVRKMLNYPPFGHLITLFNGAKSVGEAKLDAENMHRLLRMKFHSPDMEILGPYPHRRAQVRGKFRYYILLKFKQKNAELERQVVKAVNNTWTVDKDPINVI